MRLHVDKPGSRWEWASGKRGHLASELKESKRQQGRVTVVCDQWALRGQSQSLVAAPLHLRWTSFLEISLQSRPGWLTSPQSGKLGGLLDMWSSLKNLEKPFLNNLKTNLRGEESRVRQRRPIYSTQALTKFTPINRAIGAPMSQ